MGSQLCTTCMAPLPLGEIGSVTKCQYCGTEARVLAPEPKATPAAAPVAVPTFPPPTAPGRSYRTVEQIEEELRERAHVERSKRVPVLIGVGVAALFVVALLVVTMRPKAASVVSGPVAVRAVAPEPIAPTPAQTAAPLLTKAGLATFDAETWTPFDPAGMPGTFEDADAIALTPWALEVARAWAPDARLWLMYVEGLQPSGHLDLTVAGGTRDEHMIDWRFGSPARKQAASAMAQVSTATVHTHFRITLENRTAKVFAFTPWSEPDRPEFVPECPIPRMLETFRANGLPLRPTYDLLLHAVEIRRRLRWVWEENMYLELDKGIAGDASCAPVAIPD